LDQSSLVICLPPAQILLHVIVPKLICHCIQASTANDARFSVLPGFEDTPLPPPVVELKEAVALTSPEVQVTIILFFLKVTLVAFG